VLSARARLGLLALAVVLAACAKAATGDPLAASPGLSTVTEPTSGVDPVTESSSTTTSTAPAGPSTTPSTAGTTSTAPPDAAGGWVDRLVVQPEGTDAGYRRALFEHWIDADGDGCDTRCEVLAAERRTDLPGLPSGWLSIYDGYSTDDPSELEVDHVVALAEAWRSGASTWDAARRRDFANDLDEPDALIAVTAASNRAKGDRDPAEWQPSSHAGWCQWALGWTRAKVKWGLTADAAEVRALRNILAGC
jgi:hypothetical protein